ncbi:10832_t:CDS:10, partial [Entrophospora sp. SA101]
MGSTISIGDISVKKYYKKKKNRTNLSFLSSSSSSDDKSLCSSKSSDGINVYIDGRRYLESSKYSLPNDDEEIDRMHMQHYISRFIWQKNFCSPLDDLLRYGGAKVLDVGCGAGTFLLEMGHDYPESEFLGIDISPMYPSEIKPSNVKFEQINVLEGLPYDDNSFDFVVIRNMITAFSIDDWDFCIQELIRVTKPEFEIPASNRGPVVKRLSEAWIEIMKAKSIDITYSNRLKGLFSSYNDLININHNIKLLPMGTWNGDGVGKIMAEDLVLLAKAFGPILLLSWGITSEQYNYLVDNLTNELDEYKTYSNIHEGCFISSANLAWLDVKTALINEKFAPEILPIEPALDNLYVELNNQMESALNNFRNAKSESSYIGFMLLADVERMKYIIQKYTMIRISKIEKQLELILNTPVYLQRLSDAESVFANNYKKLIKQFEKDAFLDDINDIGDDEIERVEEENSIEESEDIDLLSSQLDLQKTIFCRAIRMVHENQLPKSDGENYFLDRMSPNEIYLLRYSEIKQLLLE